MPKLVSIDDQRYAALTLQSLRVTIGPLQASTTSLESQESYLTAAVLSHGSIMLPPRQPHVFARLAHWQLTPNDQWANQVVFHMFWENQMAVNIIILEGTHTTFF